MQHEVKEAVTLRQKVNIYTNPNHVYWVPTSNSDAFVPNPNLIIFFAPVFRAKISVTRVAILVC